MNSIQRKCSTIVRCVLSGLIIAARHTEALNIGQCQTRMNGDMSKILKMVRTNINEYNYGPEGILPYFNTTYNDNVAPGGYLRSDDEVTYFPQHCQRYLRRPLACTWMSIVYRK